MDHLYGQKLQNRKESDSHGLCYLCAINFWAKISPNFQTPKSKSLPFTQHYITEDTWTQIANLGIKEKIDKEYKAEEKYDKEFEKNGYINLKIVKEKEKIV